MDSLVNFNFDINTLDQYESEYCYAIPNITPDHIRGYYISSISKPHIPANIYTIDSKKFKIDYPQYNVTYYVLYKHFKDYFHRMTVLGSNASFQLFTTWLDEIEDETEEEYIGQCKETIRHMVQEIDYV
jgi:hypothetical protein